MRKAIQKMEEEAASQAEAQKLQEQENKLRSEAIKNEGIKMEDKSETETEKESEEKSDDSEEDKKPAKKQKKKKRKKDKKRLRGR